MKIYSFPPIINEKSKVLVLGTMPGKRSLELNQYYGHGSNQFWPILFELFVEDFTTDYAARKELVLSKGIALWDVLQACERESSADSDIVNEVPNDFSNFFQEYDIKAIFHNGKNPKAYFDKYVGNQPDIPQFVMPSTSPANARFTKDQKLKAWRVILDWV